MKIQKAKITNITSETQNLISVSINLFTPAGTEAEDMSIYLADGRNPYLLDDLRSGATYEFHKIAAYEGDGQYVLEIGTFWGDPVELFFDVAK